ILREGINVHGLNTAATLWCSAMVGTFAGAGYWEATLAATGFVVASNWLLRPLVRRLNARALTAAEAETHYTIEITGRGAEEANTRATLQRALAEAGLGLHRIHSADIIDTAKVTVTAQAVTSERKDAAIEAIVGRLSLEPFVIAAFWQIDRAIPEA